MRRDVYPLLATLVLWPTIARPEGNPLGPEFRVNTYTTGLQGYAAVTANGSGFVVVWSSQQDGSSLGIYGQRYGSAGSPLGPEFRINTFTTSNQTLPSVASDATGNFVVAWQSYGQDGSDFGIFGQRYASSGAALGPEFRVNAFTEFVQRRPSVASDSSGNLVVVWQSFGQDGMNLAVIGQRYASSGAPLGTEFLVNSTTAGSQYNPAVAADSAGDFVVVWQSPAQDGSTLGVFAQRFASSGAALGNEFRVNSFTTGAQLGPRVASDSLGNVVVVWNSVGQDGWDGGIFGQRYAASGAPLGPEFLVNTFTTNSQGYSAVASDASGNFVVVWNSYLQDGSHYGLFGQRFAGTGNPLGPEFRVNTYTTGVQANSAVATDPSGNFVVSWMGTDQDGPGSGVFGQRYNQILPVELMHFGIE